jgi:NADP-dependent 3-hydroxy acid dehydrogenase YdfG
VEEKFERIDVLVNNAGINRIAHFADETDINGW